MAEFAKGEWKIIGKSEMDGIEIGIDNKDGTKCPIANVNWYGKDDVNAEQDEATARLITAAPNLLEACKGLVEDSEILEQDENITACQCMAKTPDDITEPLPCNYCIARVAIAKATHKP